MSMNDRQRRLHICLCENGFVPADAENHSIIKRYNADNRLYEMTACSIVAWSDEYHTLYKIIDGFLCIANFYPDGECAFLIARPQDAQSCTMQRIIDRLYTVSRRAGLDILCIREIEERFLEDYRQLNGYSLETGYNDDMSEYIYSANSLLDPGVNRKKRRLLKKYDNKPGISFQAITPENFCRCLDMEKQWCESQDCDKCRSFVGCARKTPEIMAAIFDGSAYQGILGFVDATPVGYIIFEKISDDDAYFYFTKTTMPNFSMYLYNIATQRYLNTVKRINMGADIGKQGLRLFKRSLGHYNLQKKYYCTITRKGCVN